MCIAPSHDAHDATSQALHKHHAITKLHFIHFDAVIGDLLFDPTLKAQHLHDWISLNSRWDEDCIARPKMMDCLDASSVYLWRSIPESILGSHKQAICP
jgi:hypothetical protein